MKNIIQIVLLLFAVVVSSISFAQNPITLHSEERLFHLNDPAKKALVFTFKYISAVIYLEGNKLIIKPPLDLDISNAAFFFLGSIGKDGNPSKTIILFNDFFSPKPLLFIDSNQNFDFTDDGPPRSFTKGTDHEVPVSNLAHPNAKLSCYVNYFEFKDDSHRNKIESYVDNEHPMYKGNTYSKSEFWLAATDMNFKLFSATKDFPEIALNDLNFNGLFNDVGVDKILLSDSINHHINNRSKISRFTIEKDLVIKLGNKNYLLIEVDPVGNFIRIEPSAKESIKTVDLRLNEPMPDFNFTLFSDKITTWKLVKSQAHYTLIDFWGTWCKPCLEQTNYLKRLNDTYGERLRILSLASHEDQKTSAINYVAKKKLTWLQGFADAKLIKDFSIADFPFYILVDQGNKIVKVKASLQEIEDLLKK